MEIALLSKEEARRLLKISRSTFWRLEKKDIIGRYNRFCRRDDIGSPTLKNW